MNHRPPLTMQPVANGHGPAHGDSSQWLLYFTAIPMKRMPVPSGPLVDKHAYKLRRAKPSLLCKLFRTCPYTWTHWPMINSGNYRVSSQLDRSVHGNLIGFAHLTTWIHMDPHGSTPWFSLFSSTGPRSAQPKSAPPGGSSALRAAVDASAWPYLEDGAWITPHRGNCYTPYWCLVGNGWGWFLIFLIFILDHSPIPY